MAVLVTLGLVGSMAAGAGFSAAGLTPDLVVRSLSPVADRTGAAVADAGERGMAKRAKAWPICNRSEPRSGCVVDGDTIWSGGVKIRLAATVAPETQEATCDAERRAGYRARDRLAELLAGGFDIVPTGRTDRYGRVLASLRAPGGDVETVLTAEGLSLRYAPGREAWRARKAHWCGG